MDLSAAVRFDHQLLAVEHEHTVHCMLELTAPPAPVGQTRLPLHLVLVIDRSGSMAGAKLATAIESAAYLARRLSPTDELAIVTYDDEVRLNVPLAPVGTTAAQLEVALRGIYPGGMTNLSGGWLKGLEQLRRVPGGTGPKKILVLSDGLANRGITEPGVLVQMAHGASDDGVGTTTIGFGDGFDEDLMTGMADAGAGNAYFAATPEEAPGIFADEFVGLASIVAQNLSIELRPSDDVKMLGLLNDHPGNAVPGGVQIQLGDVYAEEHRRLVFEMFVPRLEELGRELPVRFTDQDKDSGRYSQAEQVTWEVASILPGFLAFAVDKYDRFIAAKLLAETLLTSGAAAGDPRIPPELADTSRKLNAALERKLAGPYGLRLRDGRWSA